MSNYKRLFAFSTFLSVITCTTATHAQFRELQEATPTTLTAEWIGIEDDASHSAYDSSEFFAAALPSDDQAVIQEPEQAIEDDETFCASESDSVSDPVGYLAASSSGDGTNPALEKIRIQYYKQCYSLGVKWHIDLDVKIRGIWVTKSFGCSDIRDLNIPVDPRVKRACNQCLKENSQAQIR